MSLICLCICPQMVANMASGLLAEPGPGGGAGVADKTQRVRSVAAVEAHPKHGGEQSQRKTLTQASKKGMEHVQDYKGGEGGRGNMREGEGRGPILCSMFKSLCLNEG